MISCINRCRGSRRSSGRLSACVDGAETGMTCIVWAAISPTNHWGIGSCIDARTGTPRGRILPSQTCIWIGTAMASTLPLFHRKMCPGKPASTSRLGSTFTRLVASWIWGAFLAVSGIPRCLPCRDSNYGRCYPSYQLPHFSPYPLCTRLARRSVRSHTPVALLVVRS